MAQRYNVRVRTEFSAAHVLRDYPGACNRVHGHNWSVEVEVECTALDAIGMGVDFRALRAATERIAEQLDHRLLNDVPPFDEVNPTAENVAALFFRGLGRELPTLGEAHVRLASVTVAENDRCSVRYSED